MISLFSNKLVGCIVLATFIFLICYMPEEAYLTRLKNEGITTSGTITEIEIVRGSKGSAWPRLSISFRTREGHAVNIKRDGSRKNFVNQRLEIIYLRDSPEKKAEIKDKIDELRGNAFFCSLVIVFIAVCIFGNIRKSRGGSSFFAPLFPTSTSQRRTVFLKSLFAVLAQVTKADGVIRDEEIGTVEKISQKMGLSPKEYEKMAGHFNAILDGDKENLNQHLNAFAKEFQNDGTSRLLFLRYLFMLAVADKQFHRNEEIILENTAKILNISSIQYNNLLNEFVHNGQSSKNDWHTEQFPIRQCYDILGLSPNCSNEEIRQAYRALVLENHPDKLLAKGIPPQALKCADEHFAQIQNAYDQIRKIRGIS